MPHLSPGIWSFSLSVLPHAKNGYIVINKWGTADYTQMLFKGMKGLQQEQIQLNRIKTTIRFIKSGEVVSKMSRRFFIFCTKNKIFCTNFPKRKGCLSGVL